MRHIIYLIILLPSLLFSQEKEKRTSLFVSTSQGLSFLNKEALSNTNEKTFATKPGYAFSFATGLSLNSKKGASFSDIKLVYRSYSNGILATQYLEKSALKNSTERFNYLGLGYQYSRYIKALKGYKSFLNIGVEFSYILNKKVKINYNNRTAKLNFKGKDISRNYGIVTPVTLTLGYGIEFKNSILHVGQLSRLSANLTLDKALLPISSPSNQYIGGNLKYQLLF